MFTYIDFHSSPITNILKSILLELPFSRKCESEADYIGLLLMAGSCYNPNEALTFWSKMASTTNHTKFSFISTHPTHGHRIENIKSWLPEAQTIYNNGNCKENLFLFSSLNKFNF